MSSVHKESENICLSYRQAQQGDQGIYILIRKRISLGGCPRQSTSGIAMISAGNKAEPQGHMVLTLFSPWTVSSRLQCIIIALSFVPPNLGKACVLCCFPSAPRSFSSTQLCQRPPFLTVSVLPRKSLRSYNF